MKTDTSAPGSSRRPLTASPRGATDLWPILGAVVLIVLLWALREPMMLFFGAVLVAATLRALADPLAARLGWSTRMAVSTVLVSLVVLTALGVWLTGDQLASQLQTLPSELPKARDALNHWLAQSTLGSKLLDLADHVQNMPVPWAGIAGIAGGAARALSAIVLVLLMGIYLGYDVGLYRRGLVRLFPPRSRDTMVDAFDATGQALTRWLLGQAITMIAVGVLVAAGLGLAGIPLALALGLIAGLLEFVPFFGPIASGLLAVLVSFVQGPKAALTVAVMFVAIQQVEGNVLVPLVQRWAVRLPPVLGVAGVIVFGALFGVWGVLFGTPLMVVAMVLVEKLYVEHTLEGTPAAHAKEPA
jgi:predicted PurR-regulated permease PerM